MVFNCFERTIENVTHSTVLRDLAVQNSYDFSRRTLLVNNVDSPGKWRTPLEKLVEDQIIDRWISVADALPEALRATGLRMSDITPREHWSDFALVAVTLPGPPLVCYCDPEIEFSAPGDWITPAIELMESDPRVAVANPRWSGSVAAEDKADEVVGDFFLGYGFTDQIFLLRRSEFGTGVYRPRIPVGLRSPASLRYPGAADSAVFEMRADAYMRARKRLRATHRYVTYTHSPPDGSSYAPGTVLQKLLRLRNHAILKVLVETRLRSPRMRLHGLMDNP